MYSDLSRLGTYLSWLEIGVATFEIMLALDDTPLSELITSEATKQTW